MLVKSKVIIVIYFPLGYKSCLDSVNNLFFNFFPKLMGQHIDDLQY